MAAALQLLLSLQLSFFITNILKMKNHPLKILKFQYFRVVDLQYTCGHLCMYAAFFRTITVNSSTLNSCLFLSQLEFGVSFSSIKEKKYDKSEREQSRWVATPQPYSFCYPLSIHMGLPVEQ